MRIFISHPSEAKHSNVFESIRLGNWSIFLMNETHEEGQVNVIPDTKGDGVKHVSIVKTLTRHVIPAKRMLALR